MPIGLVTAPLRMAAAGTRVALNATAAAAGVARHTSSTGAIVSSAPTRPPKGHPTATPIERVRSASGQAQRSAR
ncbi:MAG: hypothetical protein ABWY20_11290 [Mycobacterium sp.]